MGCAGCQVSQHHFSFLWSFLCLCGEERWAAIGLFPAASFCSIAGCFGFGRCAVKEAPFLFVTCEPEVIAHACVVPLTAEIESQLSQEAGGCSIWNPLSCFSICDISEAPSKHWVLGLVTKRLMRLESPCFQGGVDLMREPHRSSAKCGISLGRVMWEFLSLP